MVRDDHEVERLDPGIEGLDVVTRGGIPKGRLSLVAGTAGSGKTIFAAQFLAKGVLCGEPGVFVTFEERPYAIRRNIRSFGWDVPRWEEQGSWAFVDGAPRFGEETTIQGAFDLSPLVARVRHAVESIGAKRVSIDSVGALVSQFEGPSPTRRGMFQLAASLEELGVTTIMTGERHDDYGDVAQFGFEEFVSDNVIILRNALSGEKRRRTIEILKLRGGSHLKGEHLFTLIPREGIVVLPQHAISFDYSSSNVRMPSGNSVLDEMLKGGLLEKSLNMVCGATGTGKSLMATQFVAAGSGSGERSLLLSFEESREQIHRNAEEWGLDLREIERRGELRVVADAPESASLEDHLIRVKDVIDEFKPDRVAIDSLTALQRVSTVKNFREYVLGLTFHIKQHCRLGLVTVAAGDVATGATAADLHVSTVADSIILLQYVGVDSELRRGINILKMRGSDHDKSVREYVVGSEGMRILGPFRGITGQLAGAWAVADGAHQDGAYRSGP